MRKVSLATLAKIVGVSRPVVYTVLKKREGKGIRVSPQTKEKILKVARKLGYVAPKSAKELFTGRSDNIGVILHKLTPFFSELLTHLQQEAFKKNIEITPYITNGDPQLEEYYLNQGRDGRVDGLIVLGMTNGSAERYQRYVKPPYSLRILYYGEPISDVPTIHFDEKEAGRLAAKHLIEIGCKRLAFLGGYANSARARGFTQYIRKRGLDPPLVFTRKPVVGYFPEGKILAKKLLELKELPDGVFAFNDLLGAALLSEALEKGIRVPDNMAILGFDNTEICLYTNPALSSIDTNTSLLAKMAIEKMGKMIEGEKPGPIHGRITGVSIVARKSTKMRS